MPSLADAHGQNSKFKLADRHCLISFLFKNTNIYATLNALNLNLTEERDSCRLRTKMKKIAEKVLTKTIKYQVVGVIFE